LPTRRKIDVDFVGMTYRNLHPEIFSKIDDNQINLVHELDNPHDKFAVKCMWSGYHFAYVEREKSQAICKLLKQCSGYSVRMLSRQLSVIKAEIVFTDREDAQKSEQTMKLLGVRKDEKYFYIITDRGERKILLSWYGLPNLKLKCLELLGEKIVSIAWGDYDPRIWFSDIEKAESIGKKTSVNSSNTKPNFPMGKAFENQKSYKIFGPPGTGKTTTLIKMVEAAIRNEVQPQDIAFISFSNAAANVAKERVSQKFKTLGPSAFPNFSTMHSFATKIGGMLGQKLCQSEHMQMFDKTVVCSNEWTSPGDPSSVVFRYSHPILDLYSLSISRQEDMDYKQPRDWRVRNDARKALQDFFDITIPQSFHQIERFWEENYENLCQKYIKAFIEFKFEQNIITFDDVITKVVSDQFPEGSLPTFDLLIIDEAQDLSNHLWMLAKRLIAKAQVTFIAGDDDQAIMSSMGASPESFVNFKVTESKHVLEQSWRVPEAVFCYVNSGVLPVLEEMPNRQEKNWVSTDKKGQVVTMAKNDENNSSRAFEFNLSDLIDEIRLDYLAYVEDEFGLEDLASSMGRDIRNLKNLDKKIIPDWLVMSPTRASSKQVSDALVEYRIPHFLRNKPILNANPRECNIRVQTIHISKGAEAENAAIVLLRPGDIMQLADEPRLAYVAQTRAKTRMFPRVIKEGLISSLIEKDYFVNAAEKFNRMFPIKVKNYEQ